MAPSNLVVNFEPVLTVPFSLLKNGPREAILIDALHLARPVDGPLKYRFHDWVFSRKKSLTHGSAKENRCFKYLISISYFLSFQIIRRQQVQK